jgi:hypothetical protein
VCVCCVQTPAEPIEKAFVDAHVVIADYLESGPRNAEETLERLIRIIDDREQDGAIVELLKAEGRTPTLAPNLASIVLDFLCQLFSFPKFSFGLKPKFFVSSGCPPIFFPDFLRALPD